MAEPFPLTGNLIRLCHSDAIERLSHLPAVFDNMMQRMAGHGVIVDGVEAKESPAGSHAFRGQTWTFPPRIIIGLTGVPMPGAFADTDHTESRAVHKAAHLPAALRRMSAAMEREGAWIEGLAAVLPGDGAVHITMQGRLKVDTRKLAAAE